MKLIKSFICIVIFQKKMPLTRLLQSLSILLVLSCSALAQEWAWKPFSPDNKSWSILAPGPLKPDEAAAAHSSKGSYTYNDFSGFFAVIYQDAPRRFLPWKPDYSAYLRSVRDEVVKANRGTLIKDEAFSSGRLSGREVLVKFPTGTIQGMEGQSVTKYRFQRFRMFFKGRRLFIILAVLAESDINTSAVNEYFDSFAAPTPPDAYDDSYSIDEDTTLTVNAASGVLANDKDAENDKLIIPPAASPVTAPAHGTLTLNADGSFTYQPSPNYYGKDTFVYKANDQLLDSEEAVVTITVRPVNDAPVFSDIPSAITVDEMTPTKFTARAGDIDSAPNSLRFSLTNAPNGAAIDPKTGVFSWIPDEAQGPGTYTFQANVSDGQATTGATISVTVKEVNIAPQFSNVPASATINELEPYVFTAKATDPDIPAQALAFSLIDAPAGAAINPTTGVFTWTPTEAQGDGSTYKVVVRVSDGVVNTDATVNLTVREVNSAPTLAPISDQNIDELKTLSLTVKGTDADISANLLMYSLDSGAPAGMTIDPRTGTISWTPTEEQGAGDYSVPVRVTDNGTPALSDTKTFKVHVNEVNVAPRLDGIVNKTTSEETLITFTVTATDTDLPVNRLSYSLTNAPAGAVIDPATGVFTWTPTEAQGPGTYNVTFRVTDNGTPALSDQQTVTITVNEVNVAPKLNVIGQKTIAEETLLTFNVTAGDTDLPVNKLSYSLTDAPVGAVINPTTGLFTWTPTEVQGPGTYTVTFRVTDNGTPALSDQQTVTITVNEVNKPPVANDLTANTDEDTAVSLTLRAADADLPVNTLKYSIATSPTHGRLSGNGPNLTYTPNPDFNGTDSFTFKVNDGALDSNTASVSIIIKPVNDSPVTNPDSAVTEAGVPVTVNVIANDKDIDGDTIVLTSFSNVVNGKVEIVGGEVKFTPNPDFNGTGSFNYTISDGHGGTATGSVTITVNPAKPKT